VQHARFGTASERAAATSFVWTGTSTSSASTCGRSRIRTPRHRTAADPHPRQEQVDWLTREVTRFRATWKIISADLPLGVVVPDGPVNQESVSNRDPGAPLGKEFEIASALSAFKRNRVRNVVWLTADVHHCAAHHQETAEGRAPRSTRRWSIWIRVRSGVSARAPWVGSLNAADLHRPCG
jgi:phosphodiesterase/alkaline phosphatase D-like protein